MLCYITNNVPSDGPMVQPLCLTWCSTGIHTWNFRFAEELDERSLSCKTIDFPALEQGWQKQNRRSFLTEGSKRAQPASLILFTKGEWQGPAAGLGRWMKMSANIAGSFLSNLNASPGPSTKPGLIESRLTPMRLSERNSSHNRNESTLNNCTGDIPSKWS